MTAQDTTTIFHRVINEVVNTGDLDRADAFVAPDFIDHNVATGEPTIGLDSFKQGTAALRAAFPDIQITIEDAVAAENKIAYRIAMSGTQLGPFAGFPPSGKYVAWSAIGIVHTADGKITERWLRPDTAGLLLQIGGGPAPQPPTRN
jgi:steroid delta-isomerase-like uncharacterized protein